MSHVALLTEFIDLTTVLKKQPLATELDPLEYLWCQGRLLVTKGRMALFTVFRDPSDDEYLRDPNERY